MSSSDEEESGEDELASIAIRTHELRAEKVRLEEEVAARRAIADREIEQMKARIAAARSGLLDLEIVDLKQSRVPARRFVPRQSKRFDPVAADLQFDIETAERRLQELTDEFAEQESRQKAEIGALMRKVAAAKRHLDEANAEADQAEIDNEGKQTRADRLHTQLRLIRQNIASAQEERTRKESKFRRLASDADAVVHTVYRTKSRHVH